MSEACALCGGERFAEGLVVYDRMSARSADYRLRHCRACSLISLSPAPEDPASAYPEAYEPHAAALPDERKHSWRSRRRIGAPFGAGRLLDVGCGSGRLLSRYRALGWDVRGIEPNPAAADAGRDRGLCVECVSLEHADLPPAGFDLILLHHVIEHVAEPLHALERIRAALAPGGQVIVVTPNVAGLGFRWYGSCWYGIDAPRHLHLFDVRTLRRLCEQAGLRVLQLRSEASARVLANSRHYLRSQGAVLPATLSARAATLERSHERPAGIASFRRVIRPVAWAAARVGWGENLRVRLAVAGPAS